MAEEVAAGVRDAGSEAVVKRVPETVPEDIVRKSGFKLDRKAPVAKVEGLADYDAMIFGTPPRCGNMAGQMKNFLDQAGGLWMRGSLVGKVAGVFTSSATQHGGQESTILTFVPVLMHLGFIIVGACSLGGWVQAATQLRPTWLSGVMTVAPRATRSCSAASTSSRDSPLIMMPPPVSSRLTCAMAAVSSTGTRQREP